VHLAELAPWQGLILTVDSASVRGELKPATTLRGCNVCNLNVSSAAFDVQGASNVDDGGFAISFGGVSPCDGLDDASTQSILCNVTFAVEVDPDADRTSKAVVGRLDPITITVTENTYAVLTAAKDNIVSSALDIIGGKFTDAVESTRDGGHSAPAAVGSIVDFDVTLESIAVELVQAQTGGELIQLRLEQLELRWFEKLDLRVREVSMTTQVQQGTVHAVKGEARTPLLKTHYIGAAVGSEVSGAPEHRRGAPSGPRLTPAKAPAATGYWLQVHADTAPSKLDPSIDAQAGSIDLTLAPEVTKAALQFIAVGEQRCAAGSNR
jgi:hypothetical protein